MDTKAKLKSFQLDDQVVFWRWLNDDIIALVTGTAVFHWSMAGPEQPTKVFERHASLASSQIISYKASPDLKWLALVGIYQKDNKVAGAMQLHSVEKNVSQALEAHAAAFGTTKVDGKDSTLLAFTKRTATESKLYIIEVPPENSKYPKKAVELFFPPEADADFPVAMHITDKYNIVFVVTKFGFLHLFDLDTGTLIYRNRISSDTIFVTTGHKQTGGLMGIDRKGRVLLVAIDDNNIVPYITNSLSNYELAIKLASKAGLGGADDLFNSQFQRLFQAGQYAAAAKVAAESPRGILRTPKTMALFQNIPPQPGQAPPLLAYFSVLLESGKLNKIESLELARIVLQQQRKQLLEGWLGEDKLECSEELGDLVKPFDVKLALGIYVKANSHSKVCLALAETGQYDKIVLYAQKVNFNADWKFLLNNLLNVNPEAASSFAQNLINGKLLDLNVAVDMFTQRGPSYVPATTSLLLDVLKGNKAEEGHLQTRLLEINLIHHPKVADAILGNEMFSHYDRVKIGQMCEKAGLPQRALEHFTNVDDIKRVMGNQSHLLNPEWLVGYFARLSAEDSLECLKNLLRLNPRQNLQMVVNVCQKYSEALQPARVIDMFEQFKIFDGMFFYLGAIVNTSDDPVVHNKYIEAAAKTGNLREVERIVRDSSHYDPVKVKDFLKEAKLADLKPLIIVCDKHNFVDELTQFLYKNNQSKVIEAYVQQINPSNTPAVVGALIDVGCNDDYIQKLILSVRNQCPVDALVEQVEKRNKLKLVMPWLEQRVSEGSTDADLHNALAKIYIDTHKGPKEFLQSNQYYNPLVVGKYCEKRDPELAVIAYKRGNCDKELIEVTNTNGLYKHQARYVVTRANPELYTFVLNPENKHRPQLIEAIVQTALPEVDDPEVVSVTVKAFMDADLPNELIGLLDKLVLESKKKEFTENRGLQNLLILTAIKVDQSKVMNYVTRLDKYDANDIANVALQSGLPEVAFTIFKKFNLAPQAVEVLITHLKDLDRAKEFADKINKPEVHSKLAKAFLENGRVVEAINFYVKAEDPEFFNEVIYSANNAKCWNELIKYLVMCRKKVKESRIESELAFAYAKTNQLGEVDALTSAPGCIVDNLGTGDRCFAEGLYEAAKIFYKATDNYAKLAQALVRLRDFTAAVDAAKKANSMRTWKEVNLACVEEKEFRLAQQAGLYIVTNPDELETLVHTYESRGYFSELIQLLEAGKNTEEGGHKVLCTDLAILYSKYQPEKLMDYLKANHERLNIPKVINVVLLNQQWSELRFLYIQDGEVDQAAQVMINHSAEAWDHQIFRDVLQKVHNTDICYRGIQFYFDEHPKLVVELLSAITAVVDPARVIQLVKKMNQLPLIKPWLVQIQEVKFF